jgi:hypothetical protein
LRLRLPALLCLLAILPCAQALAQPSPPPLPPASASFLVSPGDLFSSRILVAGQLQANANVTIVLFDPEGGQTVLKGKTDGTGRLQAVIQPPLAGWHFGVYRAAIALPDLHGISATFAVGDGDLHLYAGLDLPSPSSAFILTGTGFPRSQSINLVLTLASGYGSRNFQVQTQSDGSFTSLAWPEEYRYPFWTAGRYSVSTADGQTSAIFWVREHPNGSYLTVTSPVEPNVPAEIAYQHYGAGRYLWTVYADMGGRVLGEYLTGPSDAQGFAQGAVRFPYLPSGEYLLGTPYDWGETAFALVAPTSTPAATATPTMTASPLPPAPPKPKHRKMCKKLRGKRPIHCRN